MDVHPPYGGPDLLGNWDDTSIDSTTETRSHNIVNQLIQRTVGQDPQISLTYDDAGNLTQDGDADPSTSLGTGGDHRYTWDYRNRLIEVEEKQSGNWNTTAEYKYDARSRRILKVVTNKGDLNGTTRFIWGGPAPAGWECRRRRPLGRGQPLHLHRPPRGRGIRPHAVQTSVLRPDARPRHERGSEMVS